MELGFAIFRPKLVYIFNSSKIDFLFLQTRIFASKHNNKTFPNFLFNRVARPSPKIFMKGNVPFKEHT